MKSVFVTGYGVIAPVGMGIEKFAEAMFEGRSGVRDPRGVVVDKDFPIACAGLLPDNTALSGETARGIEKWFEKAHDLDLALTKEALSYLPPETPIDSIVYGNIPGFQFEHAIGLVRNPNNVQKTEFGLESTADHACDGIAEAIARHGHGQVPSPNRLCISGTCTTGAQAIGIAFENIRSGKWKRTLVIASEWRPLESGILSLDLLSVLARPSEGEPPESVSRPFDATRSGAVRSHGGAAIILESQDGVPEARFLAEISGFGSTNDAYGLLDGSEDVESLAKAIELALLSSGAPLQSIDYINAHGTSTRKNDRLETKAIKKVFGDRAVSIPVSSLKSQIGHTVAAAGAIETVACVLMLQRQKIAPTLNYRAKESDCDLDYVPNHVREAELNRILKLSIGFGGNNACLVINRVPLG